MSNHHHHRHMETQNPSTKDFCLILLALVFPWASVAVKKGICSWAFLLSILLTVAFHLPAIVYAIYIVLANPERRYRAHDVERGYGSSQFPAQAPVAPPAPPKICHHKEHRQEQNEEPSSSEPPKYSEIERTLVDLDNKVQHN